MRHWCIKEAASWTPVYLFCSIKKSNKTVKISHPHRICERSYFSLVAFLLMDRSPAITDHYRCGSLGLYIARQNTEISGVIASEKCKHCFKSTIMQFRLLFAWYRINKHSFVSVRKKFWCGTLLVNDRFGSNNQVQQHVFECKALSTAKKTWLDCTDDSTANDRTVRQAPSVEWVTYTCLPRRLRIRVTSKLRISTRGCLWSAAQKNAFAS